MERSIVRKMLDGLLRGFGAGLVIELLIRALVAMGLLTDILPGFLFVIFWCMYANYFYFVYAGDRFLHNLAAAIIMGLLFGTVAAAGLLMQGYLSAGVPVYAAGFSLLLSWAMRSSVRRARRRAI